MATICDQGSTNREAIKTLVSANLDRPGPYFIVNGKKITIFDPPHLLKDTRTALFKYNIKFENNKIANAQHIIDTFHLDQQRPFQALTKIRYAYLDLQRHNKLKMKVSVAAKVLSNTVAVAIYCLIGTEPGKLPSDAVNTARFVQDMDILFDSFNGRTIRPEKGKPYRRCLSQNSRHWMLWRRMRSEIFNWTFISKDGKNQKKYIPFKDGWVTTITATMELFKACNELGMNFLKTRSLNQDPLENQFAGIRQFGAANTNPNPYQFISCFKTSILNSLITPFSSGQNCEQDRSNILDSLQSYLVEPSPKEVSGDDFINELINVDLSAITISKDIDIFDAQTLTYFAGFLSKKIKTNNCEFCKENIYTDTESLQPEHTFTMFKEVDDKYRLKYVNTNMAVSLKNIYVIVYKLLPTHGYVTNLLKKICLLLKQNLTQDWITCTEHKLEVEQCFYKASVSLIIRKYYNDIYRSRQSSDKTYELKKMRNIKHL